MESVKHMQERIDKNTVLDLDKDRQYMINYLSNTEVISYDSLQVLRKHYECLTEHRLLKLESAMWLILIWKEIHRRDHLILNQELTNDQGKEF
jgi:hypothetical protein